MTNVIAKPSQPMIVSELVLAAIRGFVITDPGIADPEKFLSDFPVILLVVRTSPVVYGKYDDAFALVIDGKVVGQWWGNSDPGRTGINKLIGKRYARIDEGVIIEMPGRHKDRPRCFRQPDEDQAEALGLPRYFRPGDPRQKGRFRISRMSTPTQGEAAVGYFALNFHDAPETSTGSAGCLTMPKSTYDPVRDLIYQAMGTETSSPRQRALPVVIARGPIS